MDNRNAWIWIDYICFTWLCIQRSKELVHLVFKLKLNKIVFYVYITASKRLNFLRGFGGFRFNLPGSWIYLVNSCLLSSCIFERRSVRSKVLFDHNAISIIDITRMGFHLFTILIRFNFSEWVLVSHIILLLIL